VIVTALLAGKEHIARNHIVDFCEAAERDSATDLFQQIVRNIS
jgi:hypothetical protein